jgi:hypothetical protein
VYASARGTVRQFSIAPVGHGAMHAVHDRQVSGSTT